jgi:hypothetical protein
MTMTSEQLTALLDLGGLIADVQTEVSELKATSADRVTTARVLERVYGLLNSAWLVLERLHHPTAALLDGAGPSAVNGRANCRASATFSTLRRGPKLTLPPFVPRW